MDALRAEVFRIGDVPPDVEAEAADARLPTGSPAFARAFAAAGGEPLLVRFQHGEKAVGHALLLETRAHGFGSWSGLGGPVLRADVDVWPALVEAGLARGVVSASWRDLTLTRLGAAEVARARSACEARGGAVALRPMLARVLSLKPGTEALFAGLHRKHRNAVRLAEASGVVAGRASRHGFAAEYVPLSASTWARSGQDGPPAPYFEALLRSDGFVPYLARDASGAPVAAAIVAQGEKSATYLHGASSNAAPGASTLLQWRIVEDLATQGVVSYDLGGDPVPGEADDTPRAEGIRRFKERFGGESVTYARLHLQLDPAGYARAKAALAAERVGAG